MVLRKPYAFFIKMFRPIHLLAAIFNIYMIFSSVKILDFLSKYIHSDIYVVGQTIRSTYNESTLYLLPSILIILSGIIFGVMYRKGKQITAYFISIMLYIAMIVIYTYAFSFLGTMEKNIVAISSTKLIHDLVLINVIIETVLSLFYIIRGMGIDFKKFNFDSDIAKFDISESDKEEFEVSVNFDSNEYKRRRRKRLRNLKYFYFENKFMVNVGMCVFAVAIAIVTTIIILKKSTLNKQGTLYSFYDLNIIVNDTYLTNENYLGKKITDDYLVVVNAGLSTYYSEKKISNSDFKLEIGDVLIPSTTKYSDDLIDIGKNYKDINLSNNLSNYLIVFEVSQKYINSNMILNYTSEGNTFKIRINPKEGSKDKNVIEKSKGEYITFEKTLGDIKFKIDDYSISNKFLIEYKYCFDKKNCVDSKEYLVPSVDENFEKSILKLNISYSDKTNLGLKYFYDLLSKFGSISYRVDNKWYVQKTSFEKILSKKLSQPGVVYIGVNSKMLRADTIILKFNIRNVEYDYVLVKAEG